MGERIHRKRIINKIGVSMLVGKIDKYDKFLVIVSIFSSFFVFTLVF
jgi:hypothetical protein